MTFRERIVEREVWSLPCLSLSQVSVSDMAKGFSEITDFLPISFWINRELLVPN